MKKILPISLCILCGALTAGAAGHMSLNKGKFMAKSHTTVKAKTPVARLPKTVIPSCAAPSRIVTRAEETHDEIRLASSTYKKEQEGWYSEEGSITYTYDQYGFPASRVYSDGRKHEFNYTWNVPGKQWSEKITKEFGQSGDFNAQYIVKREYHDGGQLKKEISESGVTMEYDENGYLIRHNDGYGSVQEWLYVPVLNRWYNAYSNDYERNEFTVTDMEDGGIELTKKFYRLYGTEWVLGDIYTEYYDSKGEQYGNMQAWYRYDEATNTVSLDYGYGYRNAGYRKDGMIVEENQNWDSETGKWRIGYRTERTENYEICPWHFDAGTQITSRNYNCNENGELVVSSEETYTWITDNFIKCVDKYGDDVHERFYIEVEADPRYSDDNGITEVVFDESTGNYTYWMEDYEDEDADIYVVCKPDGTVIEKFREKHDNWARWDGSAWVKCTGAVTIIDDSDEYFILTFDDLGRLVKYVEYDEGELDYIEEYTYPSANERFGLRYEDEVKKDKDYEINYRRYDDKGEDVESWYREYEDGVLTYCHRYLRVNDKLYVYYSGYENGEWTNPYWQRNPDDIENPDGTLTRIEYNVDEQGNETYRSKYISRYDEHRSYEEIYRWDEDAKKWIGEYKYNNTRTPAPEYKYIIPADPAEHTCDIFVETSKEEDADREISQVNYDYIWDEAADDWKLVGAYGRLYVLKDANTLEIKNLNVNSDSDYSNVITYQWNDANMLVFQSDKSMYNGFEYTRRLTYDADNRVLTDLQSSKDDYSSAATSRYEYTYAPIPVLGSGVADIVADIEAGIAEVYTLGGARVDVANLAAGIYIVKYSNGDVRKVAVK